MSDPDDGWLPPTILGTAWVVSLLVGLLSTLLTHASILPQAVGEPLEVVALVFNLLLVVAVGAIALSLALLRMSEVLGAFFCVRLADLRAWFEELSRDDDGTGKWG